MVSPAVAHHQAVVGSLQLQRVRVQGSVQLCRYDVDEVDDVHLVFFHHVIGVPPRAFDLAFVESLEQYRGKLIERIEDYFKNKKLLAQMDDINEDEKVDNTEQEQADANNNKDDRSDDEEILLRPITAVD